MNSYPHIATATQKSGLSENTPAEPVYREQVKLLYQQLPYTLLAALVVAPVYAFMVWDNNKPYPVIAWLVLMLLLGAVRYRLGQKFKSLALNEINTNKWEKYFLAGALASALLWSSTCMWIKLQSPIPQQTFQIFILTALIGGSLASLSSRPRIFQLFLFLILLPYIIRFVSLDTIYHLAVAGLLGFYFVVMIPISLRLYHVITKSLQLRYKNLELLESCEEANRYNKMANEALFEQMKKNKTRELALKESETFLRSILVTANDGIMTSDAKGTILAVNHAIKRIFGYSEKELVGKSLNVIMADDMGPKHDEYIEQYFNSDTPSLVGRMLDVMGKRKDGSLFPMEITVSEARIDDKVFFTGIIRDITRRKEYEKLMYNIMRELAQAKLDLEGVNSQLHDQNKELTELSERDALTGLANRRFMINAFNHEWPRLQRSQKPISVILLDVDYFKRFNDSYGHQAGDGCLKEIVDTLAKSIARPADFIARYGGEEFIAVLPETGLDGACYLAEKMRHSIDELDIDHNDAEQRNHVTISAGVASTIPNQNNDYQLLIKQADEALYEAKHSGRNCVNKYSITNSGF